MTDLYLNQENAWVYVKDKELLERHMDIFQNMSGVAYNNLRLEARRVGKNLDQMIEEDPVYADVARSVVADVILRYIAASQTQEPMTQIAQSAGGYSASGTLLVPGGGLYIKKSELARLGLRRQKVGGVDFYGLSD